MCRLTDWMEWNGMIDSSLFLAAEVEHVQAAADMLEIEDQNSLRPFFFPGPFCFVRSNMARRDSKSGTFLDGVHSSASTIRIGNCRPRGAVVFSGKKGILVFPRLETLDIDMPRWSAE